ncbi:hypothetical protein V6N11_082148 [Hibiscus sabdariffa]|uniref:DUF7745 domain-containing protein n=1 Tax=Hibiscus sabdariffa TaxID=183260 RepID=A0ABR2QH77_9ROSI
MREGQGSRMSDYTHVHVKQNNPQELKEIWAQWDDNLKQDFYQSYGDITYLLDVKVEKPLIRALAQRWNVAYSCFTVGEVDLTPTVEEYTALFRCPQFQEDKVYTKIPNDKSFTKKLVSLTGATKQWVQGQIEKKGDSFCISWRCLRNLIRVESKQKKKMCMFALGIYGLVIFPKVLGYIEAAVLDIVERLDMGVTPVPAVLAETFRSLTACRINGEGRFIGCAQLLTVWFWCHFKRMAGNPYRVCFDDYSPLKDYLRQSWIEDVSEEQWLPIFQDLQEKDIVWKAPWLTATTILFKCGVEDWVPLPGLWGGTAYAPLMVSRQYGSRQFIPATQGLQDANSEYQGDNYREKIRLVAVSWNRACRIRVFSEEPRFTSEYLYWRVRRVNDNIPLPSSGVPLSVEEHLRVIPTEVEILKQDFIEKSNRFGKRIAKLEDEKFQLGLDIDVEKERVKITKKGKNKVEEELDLWKEDYKKMLAERKMAGLGKTSGQWRAELQQEKEKVDFWKRKHQEAETQQNLMREELTDRRVENVNLRTQISEQVEDLECSLQTCQEELESFKELQEYEKARWEA